MVIEPTGGMRTMKRMMVITNWFSVIAGLAFVAAVPYGIFIAHQDWRIIVLYGAYALVNVIVGTM